VYRESSLRHIREANDIAGLYPDHQRLIGSEATTPRVLENIQKADVLHFASHYIVDERSPILSYLVLAPDGPNRSDGLLSASDILRTKLDRAPLVVLSACETGIEGYYDGEGMVGMSRAFLIAGAPLVIGTLWGIDSEPSADLMIAFHKYRKMGGLPALDALRRAQRDVLRAGPGGRGRPYWWAGFEAIGGLTTF
jgi:CHAT domain-containing protein